MLETLLPITAEHWYNDEHNGNINENWRQNLHDHWLLSVWFFNIRDEILEEKEDEASWVNKLNAESEVALKEEHPEWATTIFGKRGNTHRKLVNSTEEDLVIP